MVIFLVVRPAWEPKDSTFFTTSCEGARKQGVATQVQCQTCDSENRTGLRTDVRTYSCKAKPSTPRAEEVMREAPKAA